MTATITLSVIIVGAGLGGLAAAIGCARAGHQVFVLEGAKQLSEVGAGIQITPNASNIILKWGLGHAFAETWAEPKTCTIHRYSDGKVLAFEDNFDLNNRRKYDSPFVDMHRVDMQKLLYNKALELGVSVRLASRVLSVRVGNNGPEAILENGHTVGGDLLVGADGLWSRCRECILGKSDPPLPTGDLAYRIVLTLDQIEDTELQDWVSKPALHFWIGPHSHAVGYSVRSGTVYNLVLLCPDDLPQDVTRQPGSVEEMRKLFSNWDPILTRFLDCVDSVDKWKLMYRAEMESYTNKERNIVLIADSCHPMLPYLAQGANSAIEDGAALGQALSYVKKKSDLPQVVEMYERIRKSRSESIVRETFKQRHDFHLPDGPEQEERDRIFASQLSLPEATVKSPSRWTCPIVQRFLYGYSAYDAVDEVFQKTPYAN